jgi:cysteine desulfurase / selenocysteine lyase
MAERALRIPVPRWRDDFPALQGSMNGRRIVYLDTGASAQKPQSVIDALSETLSHGYANIHRGLYAFSQDTTAKFEDARKKVAGFLNVSDARRIVFTRNATESINLVAQSWARENLREGDEIILTEMEHHANLVPWHLLKAQSGIVLRYIPVLADGALDMAAYAALLNPRTRLVSAVHVSNALGTHNDVAAIAAMARAYNPEIKVMFDGSQAVVHGPVDLGALDPDFYVFTGHKLYGPTGIGVLYGRYILLDAMPPYQGGGDMIETVTLDDVRFKPPPARFEAGTPPIAEAIALGAAIDYLTKIGMETIRAHEQYLLADAAERLSAIPGLAIHGSAPGKAAIISFTLDGAHPSDIAMVLDRMGIAIRTGHHCCMPLMGRLGVDATARVSFGLYNTNEDIEALVEGLEKVRELFA